MIIDTSQGNVEVIGDIKEFKTSIDPKNLEFITTLLSSNLYSDPEQSFIREIVSNAWDSHVEAGTTDVPVIIRFRNSDRSVTIRDYGVGLSPERFQEVYCNIGSSTKRGSNDYIGGFGIGKYSALACSNTVHITSYYEGTAYYYIMVKSGNSITTNLLMEKPTEEKNGVEVTIKNIKDLAPYNKALQYIVFFPNIYIDGACDASVINSAKLKKFDNFAAASIPISSKLLLGNVLYPVQKYHLNYESRDFLDKIDNTGIVIKFDVGEINITPNRENIIYSSDTIRKIENRIKSAKNELDAYVDKKITKNYDDIIEYYNAVSKPVFYDPITDSISRFYGAYYRIEPTSWVRTSITYNNVDLRGFLNKMFIIIKTQLPNFKGAVYDDKIYSKRVPWDIRGVEELGTSKLIILNSGARFITSAKSYIREHYDGYAIISDISKPDFLKWARDKFNDSADISNPKFYFIIGGIYDSLIKKAKRLDINNDPDFLKYKASFATTKATGVKDARETILYVWDNRGYRLKKTFKRFSHAVDFIKGLKKGIILANMDVDDYMFSTLAQLKNFSYIKARKDIVTDLRKLGLRCIVDTNWLINKDPILSIVKTLVKCFPEDLNLCEIDEVNNNIGKDLQDEFLRLYNIDKRFRGSATYRSLALKDHIPYDSYTEYLCLRLKSYLAKHKEAKALSATVGCYNSVLTTAVVIKTKAYRVSGEAYSKVKNNKLLNILCRK